MHGNVCPDKFENSLEDVNVFIAESVANFPQFGPLSLVFLKHNSSLHCVYYSGSMEGVY